MDLASTLVHLIESHFKDIDWDSYDQKSLAFSKALHEELEKRDVGLEQFREALVAFSDIRPNSLEEMVLRDIGRLISMDTGLEEFFQKE